MYSDNVVRLNMHTVDIKKSLKDDVLNNWQQL